MRTLEGKFNGKGVKIAIVAARFNEFITSKLIGGAEDILRRHEVQDDDINLFWVPGAFEIPLIAKKLAQSKKSNSSPIQTLLSVLEFHQIKANAFVDCTTGRESHPALKTLFYIFNYLHH